MSEHGTPSTSNGHPKQSPAAYGGPASLTGPKPLGPIPLPGKVAKEAVEPRRVRALLVGINRYADAPLAGCVNDVEDVAAFLRTLPNLEAPQLVILQDEKARRAEILAAMRRLANEAEPGDRLVFHFSGHGAQINDPKEVDGLSEVLCPVDFDWSEERAIYGRDLLAALQGLAASVEFTCVLDACYSGGFDRDLSAPRAIRTMSPPPAVLRGQRRYRADKLRTMSAALSTANVVLMACDEQETAADAIFDDRPNGAFTYFLLDGLRDRHDVPLGQLVQRVRLKIARHGQTPQVRGPAPRLGAGLLNLKPAPARPSEGGPWWEAPAVGGELLPQTRSFSVESPEFQAWHRAKSAASPLPSLPSEVRRLAPKDRPRRRGPEGDSLGPNEALSPGQRLVSADRHCRLEFQTDGNLVLYADDNGTTFVRWASNTSGQPASTCVMQGDGNLVIYSDQGQALWSSGTWQHPGAYLALQDDENLVIYRDHSAVWSTNTWTLRTPLNFVHCYSNTRPDVDWNTCGSAAIATMLDFWNTNPFGIWKNRYDGRDRKFHWADGEAIDAVIGAGLGPDVVFGWGTTGGRIADALNRYGLPAEVGHSGLFSSGWDQLWRRLQDHLASGYPVPVMVDLGVFGAGAFAIHWAIAYKIDHGRVYLGNCSWNPTPTIDEFLRAWHCSYLPLGFNHCAVFHQKTPQVMDRRVFDPALYLRIYDDLSAAFGGDLGQAKNHWHVHGIGEGRRASLVFDPSDYLARYGDLVAAFGAGNFSAAIDHFITYGLYEGRRGALEFDAQWYLNNHPDLVNAFHSGNYAMALEHFLNHGLSEGRQSSPDFHVGYYLSAHADLVAAFGAGNHAAAMEHWVHYGRAEGRRAVP